MKIEEIRSLAIDSIKVIKFKRFCDQRGYFTEHYRRSDFQNHPDMTFMKDAEFVQCNESFSKTGTVRGLHFQWNPYMGKLVRTVSGRMIDIVLDIRKGSPTLGKLVLYDMPADRTSGCQEWIWIPPGFAHGNAFPEDTMIEYFCSGEYSQGCEAGVSPFAADLDWTLCDPGLRRSFDGIAATTTLVTDKDRNGFSLAQWLGDERSSNFTFQALG
jgi:dTDP-4-dehydrorhamnose 3,5-epimerase